MAKRRITDELCTFIRHHLRKMRVRDEFIHHDLLVFGPDLFLHRLIIRQHTKLIHHRTESIHLPGHTLRHMRSKCLWCRGFAL